ncbi:MAG: mechanosensitive ion channel family protein [Oscillospiraceae bacterium]|nr:mechanosensitive ion channel family protein [Oscillospiraceae bacterium]
MDVTQAVTNVGSAFAGFSLALSLPTILRVIFTVLVCVIAVKIIGGVVAKVLGKSKMDGTLRGFLTTGVRVVLYFVAGMVILSSLGVDVTSLIALLSVAGLAVSLALQNTLANLAGGIQILVTQPFGSGDYIEVGGNAGVVTKVGLSYTTLTTPDNKIVHIPNSDVASARLINYNGKETRRVDWKFTASYGSDIQLVKDTLNRLIAADSRIAADPEPFVRVSDYGSSSIEYTVRVWCRAGDYWDVYFDLLDALKPAFDKAGIEMTYDHVNVHMVQDK